MKIQSIGILGLGNFGKFAASLAPVHMTIWGHDPAFQGGSAKIIPPHIRQVSLAEVAQADVLLLGVPLDAYGTLLPQLAPLLPATTLVVDVCSVKMEPERLLRLHLPHHANILVTHPLFGPQSASAGNTTGRELIVTASVGERADAVLAFCEQELGLTIHHTTAEAHDKAMAQVHALTFFVAHGLARAHVGKDVPFVTPSFAMIKDLVALDEKHTDALFATIQQGNPFAQEAREHLMRCFETIEIELQKEK